MFRIIIIIIIVTKPRFHSFTSLTRDFTFYNDQSTFCFIAADFWVWTVHMPCAYKTEVVLFRRCVLYE